MTTNDGNADFSNTRDRSGFGSNFVPVATPPQPPAPVGPQGFGQDAPDISGIASWTTPGVPPAQRPC